MKYVKASLFAARDGAVADDTKRELSAEERAPWRHRSRVYWEEREDRIGPPVGAYIRAVSARRVQKREG